MTTLVTAPRVHPRCEIAVDVTAQTGEGRYNVSRYDDPAATYVGDAAWHDISCEVIDAVTFTGRERTLDVFDVGTAQVTAHNSTGWADLPTGTTDLEVRTGREIRIGVDVDGVGGTFWLWRGWLDRIEPGYDPAAGDVVRFEAVDAKGEYGRADVPALASPVAAGEVANLRMKRVADAVNVPAQRRAFEASGVALIATRLGDRAAGLYDRVARSSGGAVFGDTNGVLVYRGRDWLVFPAGTVPDWRIGNRPPIPGPTLALAESPDGSGLYYVPGWTLEESPDSSGLFYVADAELVQSPAGSGLYYVRDAIPVDPGDDVCVNAWEVIDDRSDFSTRIVYSRSGDAGDQTVDDPVNISAEIRGVETFKMTGLETEDETTLDELAARALAVRSFDLSPRIAAATVDAARRNVAELLVTASPFFPSMYTCVHVEGGVTRFNRLMYLTGVEHTFTATSWTARLQFDDASPYRQPGDDARYDEAQYNVDRYAAVV